MRKKTILLEEIEKSVIAIMLIYGNEVNLEELNINSNYFFSPKHKIIWNAIESLKNGSLGVDILTVSTWIEENDKTKEIGGITTIFELTNGFFHLLNLKTYIKKLKQEYRRIELIRITQELDVLSESPTVSSDSIFTISNKLIELSSQDEKDRMDDLIYEVQDTIQQSKGKKMRGYSWGQNLDFLNRITGGVVNKRIYRIGAPSNVGKTQLIYGVINSLIEQDAKTAFFTLENSFATTGINILANKQGVNSRLIEYGHITADIDYLDKKRNNISIIDDKYELSDIFAKIMELKPDVVILDFVGLAKINGFKEDKYVEYATRVQQFVKKNDLRWIDLNILSGKTDNAKQDEFMIEQGEFYGSTYLKTVADVGIHLSHYKPFYEFKKTFHEDTEEGKKLANKYVIKISITKNRFGNVKVEKIYVVDFDKGGLFMEASQKDIETWNF